MGFLWLQFLPISHPKFGEQNLQTTLVSKSFNREVLLFPSSLVLCTLKAVFSFYPHPCTETLPLKPMQPTDNLYYMCTIKISINNILHFEENFKVAKVFKKYLVSKLLLLSLDNKIQSCITSTFQEASLSPLNVPSLSLFSTEILKGVFSFHFRIEINCGSSKHFTSVFWRKTCSNDRL